MITSYTQEYMLRLKGLMANQYSMIPKDLQDPAVHRGLRNADGTGVLIGVTNIGSCPTVKERDIHAETLIANFEGDLYGQNIRIYFPGYLREEKLFDSVDELREQIYKDKNRSIEENGDLTWLETGLN